MSDDPKGPEKIDVSEFLAEGATASPGEVEILAETDDGSETGPGAGDTGDDGSLEARHLRLRADFENYRRRIGREMEEHRLRAEENLVGEMLPILDNLDRAMLDAPEAGEDPFREGVRMIHRQLLEVLERAGLAIIEASGSPFDPEIHEAVARERQDALAPGTVVEELLRGYTFHGRLLRPAMVKVSYQEEPEGTTSAAPDSGESDEKTAD